MKKAPIIKRTKKVINNFSKDDYESVSHVNVRGEWIPLDSVEFLDISEDFQGYDLVTFIYEGEERQSRVTMRPR
jgi:hypothetical protein